MSGRRHVDPLDGARIAVLMGGSVAAVKTAELITGLRRRGATVRVAMTPAATRFVSAMTMQSVAGTPVTTSLWDDAGPDADRDAGHGMMHLSLSAWAEILVVAPASADLLVRLALGLADDAVTATALASTAPVLIAPAMETAMWRHPATASGVATLRARGAVLVGPVEGRLASGHVGEGRMAAPEVIIAAVADTLRGHLDMSAARDDGSDVVGTAALQPAARTHDLEPGDADPVLVSVAPPDRWLTGRHVVVTSGGTREAVDPVRFLGNHSSGRMGVALARAAVELGASVTLVRAVGSARAEDIDEVVEVEVTTADEMLVAVRTALPGSALLLMAAAVADYRPARVAERKIKKRTEAMTLELVRTVDILASLRADPSRAGVVVVGFAAETDDVEANARTKLETKALDMVVANDVSIPGIGMGADDNAVTILGRDGSLILVDRAPKETVAQHILAATRTLVMDGATDA